MKNYFYAIQSRKVWWVFGFLLFSGLFWYGYHQVNQANRPQPVQMEKPIEPNIHREYTPNDSLLDLKIERDRERSQATEKVQEILDKVGLSDEVRKQAEQELWRLTQVTAREHELENLLKAKGFKESLVTMSEKIVTVIVAEKIDAEQAGIIGQLTSEVTVYNPDQIQIVER